MRVGIFASQDIEPGEELTYDYKFQHAGLASDAGAYRHAANTQALTIVLSRQAGRLLLKGVSCNSSIFAPVGWHTLRAALCSGMLTSMLTTEQHARISVYNGHTMCAAPECACLLRTAAVSPEP